MATPRCGNHIHIRSAFRNRRGRVDRNDLHPEPPIQGPGEEPVADALVVPSVHNAQDLAGVQINDRGYPRSRTGSRPSWQGPGRTAQAGTGAHHAQHPWRQEIHVRKAQGGVADDLLDQPPRDPERPGRLGPCTTRNR